MADLALRSGFSSPCMSGLAARAIATDDELKDIYAYLHSLPPVEGPAK